MFCYLESKKSFPINKISQVKSGQVPSLRGGGSCGKVCAIIICIVVTFIIGLVVMIPGALAYTNDGKNTAAHNAFIAGAAITSIAVFVCFGAICIACLTAICKGGQKTCDCCCDCHLELVCK